MGADDRRGGRVTERVWRKSTRSTGGGNCVEVAFTLGGVCIRDSKMELSPKLTFKVTTWDRFLYHVDHRRSHPIESI
ncbi:DUF397 domain-containing protein [Streptomyces sp. NPDC017943]|uniref:DUF397 domain-containing protein n=1 Tax=Streptomyces sp. NPDC017943 TaxID=3365019 RepID=UPI00379F5E26